jgi:hypothetical protein
VVRLIRTAEVDASLLMALDVRRFRLAQSLQMELAEELQGTLVLAALMEIAALLVDGGKLTRLQRIF